MHTRAFTRNGGQQITGGVNPSAAGMLTAASLLFAPGRRPSAAEVRAAAQRDGGFTISLDPADDQAPGASDPEALRWLELLANGLTFDLEGLRPGEAEPAPPSGHFYGLPADFAPGMLEAVTLRPGPHLRAGGTMLPVVRGMAWLMARLAHMPFVQAVAWHPARTWCSPGHFSDSVIRWAEGGPFPGLGLTALAPTPEGGLQSEGLSLFTGQELRVEPQLVTDRAAGARLALRMLHWLVENGRLTDPVTLAGPGGEALVLDPSPSGRFVSASRA